MAMAATGTEAGLERPGRLPELLKRLLRAGVYHRTMTELEAMPSACLRDLGIARSDIRRFAAEAAFGETREG